MNIRSKYSPMWTPVVLCSNLHELPPLMIQQSDKISPHIQQTLISKHNSIVLMLHLYNTTGEAIYQIQTNKKGVCQQLYNYLDHCQLFCHCHSMATDRFSEFILESFISTRNFTNITNIDLVYFSNPLDQYLGWGRT